jgi:DNA polymerase delta subunit 1
MADVCKVPLEYIFANRGQGIRIYSAVLYEAGKQDQIIQTQECAEGDISYEGAIVIEPKIGMYLDNPIAVLDYNSLYPSNMIAYNLSPDTLVYVKTYTDQGKLIKDESYEVSNLDEIKKKFKIDEVSYDHHGGRQSCGYVQEHEGLLPRTLKLLLKMRKDTRKLMETEQDESQKSVLNGLQLAYKTVANSIYGQTGSRTSPIRKVEVAACTTAIGRERLLFAKHIAETEFQGDVIYGDTDSVFIKFGNKTLAETIEIAKLVGKRISSLCRSAHKIDYEKTFFPFLLFCRKRYAGLMYEDDVTKCKRKFMGISLKRRDSAPIVKDIYGGALDILLEQRSLKNAESFVKDSLVKVLKNEFPIEKFIITKQLRDDYKNPAQIAHRVLADRMTLRDPGNIPQVGERLAFIYVAGRSGKQGERIENIEFVKERKLKPDTEFYITNQIQNPLAQLFALGIEQLSGYQAKKYPEFPDLSEEEQTLKILSLKEKELDSILFTGAQYLRKEKRGPLDSFFTRK